MSRFLPIRSAARWHVLAALVFYAMAALYGPGTVAGQPLPEIPTVEALKTSLDAVEKALEQENLSSQQLADLRTDVLAARDGLQARAAQVEPRAVEAETRLKQLGPVPAKDAPPEADNVLAERERLTKEFGELDGALKQIRVLNVRAEQLGERIIERRQTLYARELFARSASVLDPSFWMEVAQAFPTEARSAVRLLSSWWDDIHSSEGWIRVGAALLLLAAIAFVAVYITRRWLPRLDAGPRSDTRFARALIGLWVFIWLTIRTPLAAMAALFVLQAFDLLPWRPAEIANGIVIALMVAAFGRGVARGLFAPDKPERRLVAVDDVTARSLHDYLVWTARALGATVLLQISHKVLFAPLVLTVATNVLFALAVVGLLVHLILSLRRAEEQLSDDAYAPAPWARLLAWVIVIAIVAALVGGYAGFAAFLALRAVVAAAILGAIYLLLVIIDALFTESIRGNSPRGRAIAANLGVAPRNVELVGTLMSAVVRVLLILLGLVLIVGPWSASTAGLFESMQNVPLGFRIGELTISFRAILAAVTALILVLIATRVVQRWLQTQFLPRTALEPSLQLSIATIFGYLGAITAISLGLGSLGIDLQKIAFVAGALSVGIGFGLQAVVSNFVSGLILLAERPIRVGDQVVVKGETGIVRRVRVRATEIETFDRATVIIPNSEFITGVVTNWTRSDTMGRFIIKVGVAYDSDPAQVRDVLLAIAADHPKVLKNPGPWAQLSVLGTNALEFELGCIVANVGDRGAVKSDLHFEILKRFRENGIAIPYAQQELKLRMAQSGDLEVLPSPAAQES